MSSGPIRTSINGYSDERLEVIAKIICRHRKLDPDEIITAYEADILTTEEEIERIRNNKGVRIVTEKSTFPRWKLFRKHALDLLRDEALREEIRAFNRQHSW